MFGLRSNAATARPFPSTYPDHVSSKGHQASPMEVAVDHYLVSPPTTEMAYMRTLLEHVRRGNVVDESGRMVQQHLKDDADSCRANADSTSSMDHATASSIRTERWPSRSGPRHILRPSSGNGGNNSSGSISALADRIGPNVSLIGWFQWHTSIFTAVERGRLCRLLRPPFGLRLRLQNALTRLLILSNPQSLQRPLVDNLPDPLQHINSKPGHLKRGARRIIAIQLRRGDYATAAASWGASFAFPVPAEWYVEWLQNIWPAMIMRDAEGDIDPLLYIATDEKDVSAVLAPFEAAGFCPLTAQSSDVKRALIAAEVPPFCASQNHRGEDESIAEETEDAILNEAAPSVLLPPPPLQSACKQCDSDVCFNSYPPHFWDWFVLTQANAVAISNSTFGFTAAMMNGPGAHESGGGFVRPNLAAGKLVAFDPWSSDPLLRQSGWLSIARTHGIGAAAQLAQASVVTILKLSAIKHEGLVSWSLAILMLLGLGVITWLFVFVAVHSLQHNPLA